MVAGHLAIAGGLREVCRAARAARAPAHPPRAVDLLLDGLALIATDGLAPRTGPVASQTGRQPSQMSDSLWAQLS